MFANNIVLDNSGSLAASDFGYGTQGGRVQLGNLLIQWGNYSKSGWISKDETVTLTFPVPYLYFPCLIVSPFRSNSSSGFYVSVWNQSATGAQVTVKDNSIPGFCWLAIGSTALS